MLTSTPAESGSSSPLDPKAAELLSELYERVLLTLIASFTWERLLSQKERDRLGNDVFAAYESHGGTAEMFACVRGISLGRAVAQIAGAASLTSQANAQWLAAELRRAEGPAACGDDIEEDLSEVVQQARTEKDLVLVTGSGRCTLYWIGERVDIDWKKFPKSWEFLRALVEQTRKGESLDFSMLGLENERQIISQKSNLKRSAKLPQDIFQLIEDCGRGRYRLKLRSDQVAAIDLGIDGWGMDPAHE